MSKIELPRTYTYNYRFYQRPGGYWAHSYDLVGRWGGVNFHVTDFGKDNPDFPDRYSAGLEYHFRQPPSYMADLPPSHDECWLLKAPCWHDGTSLYAQEKLLPLFDGQNHLALFLRLASDADDQFDQFRPANLDAAA